MNHHKLLVKQMTQKSALLKNVITKTFLLMTLATLAACGGSKSDSTNNVSSTNYTAVKGLISGADATCYQTTAKKTVIKVVQTNTQGVFNFGQDCPGIIEVSGGIDQATGLPAETLVASAKALYITPVTQLDYLVEQNIISSQTVDLDLLAAARTKNPLIAGDDQSEQLAKLGIMLSQFSAAIIDKNSNLSPIKAMPYMAIASQNSNKKLTLLGGKESSGTASALINALGTSISTEQDSYGTAILNLAKKSKQALQLADKGNTLKTDILDQVGIGKHIKPFKNKDVFYISNKMLSHGQPTTVTLSKTNYFDTKFSNQSPTYECRWFAPNIKASSTTWNQGSQKPCNWGNPQTLTQKPKPAVKVSFKNNSLNSVFFEFKTVKLDNSGKPTLSVEATAQKNSLLPGETIYRNVRLIFGSSYCNDNTDLLSQNLGSLKTYSANLSGNISTYLNATKTGCKTELGTKLAIIKKTIDIFLDKMIAQNINLERFMSFEKPILILPNVDSGKFTGADKSSKTALFNTSDYEQYIELKYNQKAQPLYANEVPIININGQGKQYPNSSNADTRSAALEEILHLLHTKALQYLKPTWQSSLDKVVAKLSSQTNSTDYVAANSKKLCIKDGKIVEAITAGASCTVTGAQLAKESKYFFWHDFGAYEDNAYKKNGSAYLGKDQIGDDTNKLPYDSLDDEYFADGVEAYFGLRGQTGYTKQLCFPQASVPSQQCASSTTPYDNLKNNHQELFGLIQYVFGTSTQFYTLQKPTNLRVAVVSSAQIRIDWNAVIDANQYEVHRATGNSNVFTKLSQEPHNNFFVDGNLANNTTYKYKIKAKNSSMFSEFSDTKSAKTVILTACQTDLANGAILGITAPPAHTDKFCKYTKVTAPNGRPIHIYAHQEISNEQVIRARSILEFYIADAPDSTLGTNKSGLRNTMANNNATLLLLRGQHVEGVRAPISGQPLHQTENVVEGSDAYFSNSPRDAAFEEILHLVHDKGIGVDGSGGFNSIGGQSGLTSYQTQIRQATNNALPPSITPVYGNKALSPKSLWATDDLSWLNSLNRENSLSQEYLASVVETYYGQTRYLSGGSGHGISVYYAASERLGNNGIQAKDPQGWGLLENSDGKKTKFFPKTLNFEVRVDPNITRTEFSLTLDAANVYTYKTQYMTKVKLLGNKNTNLRGNGYDNTLKGNAGNNVIRGEVGNDTLYGYAGNDTLYGGDGAKDIIVYQGNFAEYTTKTLSGSGGDTISDQITSRDGVDTLPTNHGIEYIRFKDSTKTFSQVFPVAR